MRWWVVAAIALGLALSSCASDDVSTTDGGAPMPTSAATQPDADFTAEVTVAADSVSVAWSLTNNGAQPLGVLNRVPSGTAGAAVDYDPTVAWVVADGDDRIQLGQQVFSKPESDTDARETTPVTGASLLEPGATLDGTVTVSRPFVGSHPYGDSDQDPEVQLPDEPADVRFCLGVLEDPSVLHETPSGELVGANDASIFAAQHLFCSVPAAL